MRGVKSRNEEKNGPRSDPGVPRGRRCRWLDLAVAIGPRGSERANLRDPAPAERDAVPLGLSEHSEARQSLHIGNSSRVPLLPHVQVPLRSGPQVDCQGQAFRLNAASR